MPEETPMHRLGFPVVNRQSSIVNWLSLTSSDVPDMQDWLTAKERALLGKLKFAKRRNDWLLGRWTAKRVLSDYLGSELDFASLAQLEVLAARDGAPEGFLSGLPVPVSLSISHSRGRSLCAVAEHSSAVGCDLEWIEPRDKNLVEDYFAAEEIATLEHWPGAQRSAAITLIWCAKESALKSLREGLRRDTRSVVVSIPTASDEKTWNSFSVRCLESSRILHGWWCRDAGFIQTVTTETHSSLRLCGSVS